MRVRERAEGLGIRRTALADFVGINRKSMTNYWAGERAYPAESLSRLAIALATDVDWLLTGASGRSAPPLFLKPDWSRLPQRSEHQHHERPADDDVVEVQEIDLAYGLGGTFTGDDVEIETHRFPRSWIERITSTPASSLTFARGRGDSMQPTILDGDMILIDRSQRSVREQDALWALTVGEIAMIKRVRVRADRVDLLSDNDRIPADQAVADEVNIVGRVIFIGRRI